MVGCRWSVVSEGRSVTLAHSTLWKGRLSLCMMRCAVEGFRPSRAVSAVHPSDCACNRQGLLAGTRGASLVARLI